MKTSVTRSEEEGLFFVPFALGLLVLIALAALVVDMSVVYRARRELQIAADGAAMAGVRELAVNNQPAARTKAEQVATSNKVAGSAVQIDTTADVQIGNWRSPRFAVGSSPTNAMRVTLRRTDATPQGPIGLFFGRALGKSFVNLSASGTATLAAVDLLIVLDTSTSMLFDTIQANCNRAMNFGAYGGTKCVCWNGRPATGYQPWDTLVASANSFVDDFNPITDQLGLEIFGNTASNPVNQALTTPFTTVMDGITGLGAPLACGTAASRATNMGAGLQYAIGELQGVHAHPIAAKMIVLVSDGQPNCPSPTSTCSTSSAIVAQGQAYALQQATAAAAGRIVIHTVSLGAMADRPLMQQVASRTGGGEYFASTAADLDGVFAEIRRRVPVQLVN